jgi:hypothetical protein
MFRLHSFSRSRDDLTLLRYPFSYQQTRQVFRQSDGPAIWGGFVTRRNSGRPPVPVFGRRSLSAGKGGYAVPRRAERDGGALFAVRVQILMSITRVAVQGLSEPRTYHRLQNWLRALAQSCPGGAKRSRESRYNLSRSHKTVTVQELNCVQMRVSGYMNHYKFVLDAGAIKNRDKLIDPTVRVMHSNF